MQPVVMLLLKNMEHKKFESEKVCQEYVAKKVNGKDKDEIIQRYKEFNDNRSATTTENPEHYIDLAPHCKTSCTVLHPFQFTFGGAQYICPGMFMTRGKDRFSKRAVEDILVVSKLLNGSEDSGSVGSVGSGGGGGGLNFFDGADFAPSPDDILNLELQAGYWKVLEAVGLQQSLEAKAIDGVEKKYAMCVNNFIGVTLTAGRQVYLYFEGRKPIFFQTQLRHYVQMTDDSMNSLNALHASEAGQSHLRSGEGIGEMVEGEVEEKMSFVMKSSGSLYAFAMVSAFVGDYKLLRMLQFPHLLPIVLRADEVRARVERQALRGCKTNTRILHARRTEEKTGAI
jgi:hypothetical protein